MMSQEPYTPPAELKIAREHGTNRGIIDGQREALSRIESEAYLEAYHSQLRAAGLCHCEELASAQASPAPAPTTDLQALSDKLGSFVAELSRIAATLQPKPAEVELVHVAAPPELKREVDSILAGLGERARTRREVKAAEQAAGRQVDADETPAPPTQQALDDDPLATPFLPRRVPNQPRLAAGGIVQPPGPLTGIAAAVDELLEDGAAR